MKKRKNNLHVDFVLGVGNDLINGISLSGMSCFHGVVVVVGK